MVRQRVIADEALTGSAPRPPSLTDQIYEQLLHSIITAHWEPGPILLEPELATTLATSKTFVREALHLLVQEGWIVILPRKGYVVRVRPLSLDNVSEVFGLRLMIELGILGDLAAEIDHHAADQLASRLAVHAETGSEAEASLDAASEFHLTAARLSHNRRAERIISGLFDEVKQPHHLLPNITSHISSAAELSAHQQIIDAMNDHDAQRTTRLMHEHPTEVARMMVDSFTSLRSL